MTWQTEPARFAHHEQHFLGRVVAGREHHRAAAAARLAVDLGDGRDQRLGLRHELAVLRDRDERPVVAVVLDVVLGVPRRHPDDASPAALDVRHLPNRGRVQAARREVRADAAEHLEVRMKLAAPSKRRPRIGRSAS